MSFRASILRARLLPTLLGPCLCLGLALGASACSEVPADGDCEKLLLHLVDVEVNSGTASEADRAKHKTRLTEETREAFVERCNNDLKASQVTCSLKAKTAEEIEACDG
jgi:hypothetical protein